VAKEEGWALYPVFKPTCSAKPQLNYEWGEKEVNAGKKIPKVFERQECEKAEEDVRGGRYHGHYGLGSASSVDCKP